MTTTPSAPDDAAPEDPLNVRALLADAGTFAIHVDDASTEATVRVQGELDVATSPQLREVLGDLTGAGSGPIVLDLSGVTFLDSTGLGALLGAKHRLQEAGRSLVLRSPTRSVLRVLEVSGLADAFPVT